MSTVARPHAPTRRAPTRRGATRRFGLPVALLPLLVVATASVGCGSDGGGGTAGAPDDGRPVVVVTTSVLGDVTANVVGDLAVVETLLPAGADPHDVELSARQVAELRRADLVVANGLGLEAGMDEALDGAADAGVPVLRVAPELAPIPFAEPDHDDEAHARDEHDHDGLDPHVWTDPDRMASAARLIAAAVGDATPVDRAALDANAAAYDAELRSLDEDIQAALGDVPAERRILVTNHESLGYFAERYGFEIVGTVIPGGGTLAEPSAAGIAELAEIVEATGVPAVFAENVADTGLADALVAEIGDHVEVVGLYTDALGPPGSGADTYIGMMRTNAERIAEALAP